LKLSLAEKNKALKQNMKLSNPAANKLKERGSLKDDIKRLEKKINQLAKHILNSSIRRDHVRTIKPWRSGISPQKVITNTELKERREEKLKAKGNYKNETAGHIIKLNWEILPAGCSWETFEPYFKNQIKDLKQDLLQQEIEEAKRRFKCILELRPKLIYKGLLSFSDYFALCFDECEEVVLESVVYGNAIYIIKGDWRLLSQKTKSDLKKSHNPKVIHHKRDWFSKLKNHLQIGFE